MAKNFYGRGGMGGMGGMNMQQAIKQAQKMQEDMQKMQEQLKQSSFEASAGGGAVTVKMSGKREITALEISPDAVDPDDVETLQDLITAAFNEVMKKIDEESAQQLGSLTGGLGGGLF